MRSRLILAAVVGVTMLAGIMVFAQSKTGHFNPMVDLLAKKQVVVGVAYPSNRGGGPARGEAPAAATFNPPPPAPAAPGPDACGNMPPQRGEGEGGAGGRLGGARGGNAGRGGGRGAGNAPAEPPVIRTPMELSKEALAYKATDYLFGSMEGGVEGPLPAFTEFMKGIREMGPVSKVGYMHLTHPVIIKTPRIARDPQKANWNISQQLNTGVSGLMFVGVECAKEVQIGLAAMRFKSKGGTRPDDVGMAPSVWGLSEKEYKDKADVWGLNPNGELINWTIVESKEGLKHLREIAAVKGIGVLWPGAGTLGGVFTVTTPDGNRMRDMVGWENAIQQVLAACKEFNVACGYPASFADTLPDNTTNPNSLELRMKQGFSVFVMQSFDDNAFKAVDLGRKLGNRPPTNN
jgi:4-hydroxy-2-oxoheptanedioate aldolase